MSYGMDMDNNIDRELRQRKPAPKQLSMKKDDLVGESEILEWCAEKSTEVVACCMRYQMGLFYGLYKTLYAESPKIIDNHQWGL